MEVTWGLGLQAIGVFLEGIGLIMALRSFGPAAEKWIKDVEGKNLAFSKRYIYVDEAWSFKKQIGIILLGLVFQLVGLFISELYV